MLKKDGVILEKNTIMMNDFKDIKIAVDVIPEKVEKLNNKISLIQEDYIEKYCYIAAA